MRTHTAYMQVLLGILDDGRVTDAKGRTVNFANTVIIMTSNLGAEHLLTMLQVREAGLARSVWLCFCGVHMLTQLQVRRAGFRVRSDVQHRSRITAGHAAHVLCAAIA